MIRLVLLVLPFQVLTGVLLDLHGPAHFHLDDDHHEAAARDHHHAALEHHHHDAGDASVVVVDDDDADEAPSGWSASMCVVLTAAPAMHVPRAGQHAPRERDAHRATRFPETPHRPPRAALA